MSDVATPTIRRSAVHVAMDLPRSELPTSGRSRVVIENIVPSVESGRFPAKRSVGETARIEVDAFTDGHDKISVALLHRTVGSNTWHEVDMVPLVNDRWAGEFDLYSVGHHEFTVRAWIDAFATWRYDLMKRLQAGQDVQVELQIGADIVEKAALSVDGEAARTLDAAARAMRGDSYGHSVEAAIAPFLATAMRRHGARDFATTWPTPLTLWVDRERARFSSWYEFFPRSASPDPSRHGTLDDVINRLDYVSAMGFDVVYLPPIHPIGKAFRKGPNNSPTANPDDLGSPWAVGGEEGGHDAIHPQLGTIEDFDRLILAARERGIDVAMDLAFQCSADHPYVRERPEWFRHRPDGSIQYAENPPKKYQDIYPFDFECEDWQNLWNELLRVTLHWVNHGVRVFRVDNPHTKPFVFWEWLIAEIKRREPEVLFLAEAFTRPKVMYRLGKIGFSQSYTYFTWRNEPWNVRQYFTELTKPPVVDFYRPNAWPNTPDILNESLQTDEPAAFVVRAVLAATLCANYGVYGPAFELMEGRPVRQGSEEYLDSEKYQIRQWNIDDPRSLARLLGTLNHIRKTNRALQHDRGLQFHEVDNPHVVCYSKMLDGNIVLVVANMKPSLGQWANLSLNLAALGLSPEKPMEVRDLLTGEMHEWRGYHATIGLNPVSPAHIFTLRGQRSETDFDYFV